MFAPHFSKKVLYGIVSLICLYFLSKALLVGTGFYPKPQWGQILAVAIWLNLCCRHNLLFYGFAFPLVLLQALYAPVGLLFGPPSYEYIASIFATDLQESCEFFAQIPVIYYVYPVLILMGLFGYRFLCQNSSYRLPYQPLWWAGAVLFLIWQPTPFYFFYQSYQAGYKVLAELRKLNQWTIESQWGRSTLAGWGYEDYILVIGESARKDYHHAYGYPVENTPFMSHAKGVLVDGLTAGGTNTIASLKLMLTKGDKAQFEGNYALNLVDLVKSAGIRTYWLSNQGYLGQFDTPISAIANKSDYRLFLKSGDSLNQNISDFALLDKFTQILNQPAEGKRFIVLHLYGSHPLSCDRLEDYPLIFEPQQIAPQYQAINCYISSIQKTDEFLQRSYELLAKNFQKNHRSFSMIYFADHGLAHHIQGESISIHNSSGKSKRHYDIPLFKIASDDRTRRQYQAMKSGLNFTEALANWIGIQNPQVNPQFNLFNNQDDPDDYGLQQQIDQISKPDDPAIVPRLN